jgi:hypothetical protein
MKHDTYLLALSLSWLLPHPVCNASSKPQAEKTRAMKKLSYLLLE